ncbi:hypothetical protein [Nocardia yunnanensis]|nr:hypothetical protein [Nocardia yunnanensis]
MSSTRRDQQPMFAFRLKEHPAKVVRDKLAVEAITAQALMETLALAWATGKLSEDVRALRAEIAADGLL